MFLYTGYSLSQSENPLFLHFSTLFFKIVFLKLKLLRHNSCQKKIYSEIPPKIGKKGGIHFYENILSEMNLPINISLQYDRLSARLAHKVTLLAHLYSVPQTVSLGEQTMK